jgi:nickel transport protein
MRSELSQAARRGRRCLSAALAGLALMLLASPAQAHRVLVFASVQGDTIQTESTFVGSGPVQKGEVQVQDKASGRVLLTGATDEKGKFSFKIPIEAASGRLDLLIIVGASLGHQGEWLLKADSYLPKTGPAAATASPGSAPAAVPVGTGAAGPKTAVVDQQALEEALNKALEKQLAPIKEMLVELGLKRRTLPEIIGGLGYILGIFGVVAYFMSKKQPRA